MALINKVMTRFDLFCQNVGQKRWFKQSFWWYTTQYNYIGMGMGKFYNIRQVIGFFVYGEIVLQGLEKIITLPHNLRKWFWISTIPVTLGFWLLGRFFDYSNSLLLEAEWGAIRSPATIEMRKKLKCESKFTRKGLKGKETNGRERKN